jgi:hypothetical protein
MKIKCPDCGSTKIQRSNPDVVVYESIQIVEAVDYMIEGGNEVRVTRQEIRSDESIPPYIEQLDDSDLEFSCEECGYFFSEDIHDDEDMLQYAIDNDLLVGYTERKED